MVDRRLGERQALRVDLFEQQARKEHRGEPLAERMRPRDLDEFVGQRHLLGAGKLLEGLLARGQVPSLIVWGPPGTGKTTLARILATRVKAEFVGLSAVSVGLKEVREVVADGSNRLR
ncbi:MAG: AAA family ATPase, partial [Myxococcota bacterium]